MENINWELILKIVAVIAGFIGSFYQFRNLKITSRSSIKTDLEILKMLKPDDPNYAIVKQYADESVRKIYSSAKESKFKIYNYGDFSWGLVFLVGFGYWSYYLSRDGFSLWSLLTGFFAFAGIGGMLSGLEPKKKKSSRSTAQATKL